VRACEACDTPFEPKRQHGRFCSDPCRLQAWARRQASLAAQNARQVALTHPWALEGAGETSGLDPRPTDARAREALRAGMAGEEPAPARPELDGRFYRPARRPWAEPRRARAAA
jgi:hypothetical protein